MPTCPAKVWNHTSGCTCTPVTTTAEADVDLVTAGAPGPRSLDDLSPEVRRCIEWARDDYGAGPGVMVCSEVSWMLSASPHDLTYVEGTYSGPDASQSGMSHDWVTTSDGTIIDATADQFEGSEDDPVRIIGPDDPRASWYARWTG